MTSLQRFFCEFLWKVFQHFYRWLTSHCSCYLNLLHSQKIRTFSTTIFVVTYKSFAKNHFLSWVDICKYAPQKLKFSMKDLFSKSDQIRRKLRSWSHLLKKSLIENFFFCSVLYYASRKATSQQLFNKYTPRFQPLIIKVISIIIWHGDNRLNNTLKIKVIKYHFQPAKCL